MKNVFMRCMPQFRETARSHFLFCCQVAVVVATVAAVVSVAGVVAADVVVVSVAGVPADVAVLVATCCSCCCCFHIYGLRKKVDKSKSIFFCLSLSSCANEPTSFPERVFNIGP